MANNRMFLECSCGERVTLAKHFDMAGSTAAVWKIAKTESELDQFFLDHSLCGEVDTHFVLKFES